MRPRANRILFTLVIIVLSGCTQGLGTTGGIGTTLDGSLRPLASVATPSLTHTPVASPTPTISPTVTITPTPAPPPDLELKDVTIFPDTFNEVSQTYFLLGRIRNNTDKIMLFHEKDKVFDFTFDVWEYDSISGYHHYRHVKYIEGTQMNSRGLSFYYANMNCILYPGDEGVFIHQTRSASDEYLINEKFEEYTGQLGFWFSYVSYYHTQTDVPLYYHIKAENLIFSRGLSSLIIDFDLDIPEHLIEGFTSLNSWIILYDKDGKIINIFQKYLMEMPGIKFGERFHFHSRTDYEPTSQGYMHPAFDLTAEMRERVDRIEVFTEFEEAYLCAEPAT